jgi:hypothetical protein
VWLSTPATRYDQMSEYLVQDIPQIQIEWGRSGERGFVKSVAVWPRTRSSLIGGGGEASRGKAVRQDSRACAASGRDCPAPVEQTKRRLEQAATRTRAEWMKG